MTPFSRRDFVAQAGVGAVAVATGLHLPAQPVPAIPHYNYDPQAQEIVDRLMAFHPPAVKLTADNAREMPTFAYAVQEVLAARHTAPVLEPIAGITHYVFPGPGGQLLVRVYTPQGTGPFPMVVYFRGGGWSTSTLDTFDTSCRALTHAVPSLVVHVAYRQAPEHKFPAAVDDAYAATQWAVANATRLGGDPTRMAVAGESSGGNLAAAVALMARDKGGAMPVHQLLLYPVLDLLGETPSRRLFTHTVPANTPGVLAGALGYLPNRAAANNPYASPLRAASLKGLPSATVITAEFDPLRDEGEAYAARLRAAGVPATATRYKGMIHIFFGLGAVIDKANQAVAEAATALRKAFSMA
jgi:acetyl esterase